MSEEDEKHTALVAHLERELRLMESDYQSTLQAEPVRTAINGSSRLVALPPLCLISESNSTLEPRAVLVPTRSRITRCVAVHDCASLVYENTAETSAAILVHLRSILMQRMVLTTILEMKIAARTMRCAQFPHKFQAHLKNVQYRNAKYQARCDNMTQLN